MGCNPASASRYYETKETKAAAKSAAKAAMAAMKDAEPAADLKKEGVAKVSVKEATTKAGKKKAISAKKE